MPISKFQSQSVRLAFILLCHGATVPPNCSAQTEPTPNPGLLVTQLVDQVLKTHPELRYYEAEIAAANAARRNAAKPANPELVTTAGQNRVHDPSGHLAGEGVAWSVGLMQQFEWPGRLGLRKAIANQNVELAELGLAQFKAALSGRVRVLCYTLSTAQQQAESSKEVADRLQSLREVLVQRDPAGIAPVLETRIIEATELIAQRAAAEADLSVTQARIELNQLRGEPVTSEFKVGPWTPVFQPPPELGDLLVAARTNNFELRIRTSELAQQGFQVQLARNERYPSLTIGPTFSEENGGDQQRIIGLAVSVPLPLWNQHRSGVDIAKARQTQAQASLQTAQRDLDRRIANANATYKSKLSSLSRWRGDAIQHFRHAADSADRNYRLGAAPVATYVELQRQYVEAENALLATRREALEAAAQLEILTGRNEPLVQWETQSQKP
jgi:cobalt-zinc-cadmium efflux system outer membrane protein